MSDEVIAVPSEQHELQSVAVAWPAVIIAATRLLDTARKALRYDEQEAERHISRATALLKTEAELTHVPSSTGHGSLKAWQMKRVVQFIDENQAGSVRMRQVAAAARLSVSHFTRAFRDATGESPSAYLRRRRVERAQELMLMTEKPLSEIAGDCGFADQAHLCRTFRRLVGASPAAWRRARSVVDPADLHQRAIG